MVEKTDKTAEIQRLKNIYEPEIKAMEQEKTNLSNEIDKLKIQKGLLDTYVESFDEITLSFGTTMLKREDEFANISSLKGNYMEDVNSYTESILGFGEQIVKTNNPSGMTVEVIQSNLNTKIEDLESDLTNAITDINNTTFLYQQALSSIV